MDELDGILITHEHTDHISGLATLIKHHTVPLYASPGTARQLAYRLAGVEPLLRLGAPEPNFASAPVGSRPLPRPTTPPRAWITASTAPAPLAF